MPILSTPVSFAARVNSFGSKRVLACFDFLGLVASSSFNFYLSQNPNMFFQGKKNEMPPPLARRRLSF